MREYEPYTPIDRGNNEQHNREERQGQSTDANGRKAISARPVPALLWLALALSVAGLFLPARGCKFPTPGPGPGPEPEIVVDPAKTLGSWVLLLEETAARTPEITRVVVNETFWSGLDGRGLKYRLIDRDASAFTPYQSLVNEVGLPCILILAPTGEVLAKEPLPATTDDLDAIVRKVTGR